MQDKMLVAHSNEPETEADVQLKGVVGAIWPKKFLFLGRGSWTEKKMETTLTTIKGFSKGEDLPVQNFVFLFRFVECRQSHLH